MTELPSSPEPGTTPESVLADDSGPSLHQVLLERYLGQVHEPCPMCHYELHGLQGSRCPECGQLLRLRVGLETPNMAAFITGLVGLAAAAGFGGLFLLFMVGMVVIEGGRGVPDLAKVVLTFGGILGISLGGVLIWVRSSGRIRRAGSHARWLLALGCYVYALFTLIVVFVVLGPA